MKQFLKEFANQVIVLYFCHLIKYIMDKHSEFIDNPVDIELNKPSKSRFLFLLGFFGLFIFFIGCNYGLWTRSYKSTEKIEVPESTQYTPKYK